MAILSISFDDGIEKLLQGTSATSLTYELLPTSTVKFFDLSKGRYIKPVLKDGYVLDSAEGVTLVENGVYLVAETSNIIFTSKYVGGGFNND